MPLIGREMSKLVALRIHDYVSSVKQSAEVEERYMTIGELMDIHAKDIPKGTENSILKQAGLK